MSWERSAPDFMKQGNPRWGSRHYFFNKFMSTSFREKTPPEELQPYLIDVLENYTSDDTREIEFHLQKRDKINPSLNSSSRPRVNLDHRPIPLMTPRPLVLAQRREIKRRVTFNPSKLYLERELEEHISSRQKKLVTNSKKAFSALEIIAECLGYPDSLLKDVNSLNKFIEQEIEKL
ncbi:11910_t:CDS:2, partial [Rhizophagus irregularis]